MKLRMPASLVLVCLSAATGKAEPESLQVFNAKIRPFLQANCFKCHGEAKTLAGLRLDMLGSDFLAGKSADVWREVYDRLGNGTMPPKQMPRPDAKKASEVTEWIAQELRNAEARAKSGSGRVPTRRLNRTEYANTLRDLLYLDDNVARTIEQELPMDGKVAGFDRGGAGLFIDEAQMTKYLEMADWVLDREVFAPKPKPISTKSVARDRLGYHAPDKGTSVDVPTYPTDTPLRNSKEHRIRIPLGANVAELKRGGIEFIPAAAGQNGALDTYGFHWDLRNPYASGKFVEGWYRWKVRAGAFKGAGPYQLDANRLTFVYAPNTSIEAKATVVVDAPLEEPMEFEVKIYLRSGGPDLPRNIKFFWNGGPKDIVVRNPELLKIEKAWSDLYYKNLRLFTRKPPPSAAELEEANKNREAMIETYNKGIQQIKVYNVFDPNIDLKAIPRIWLESFECEGPLGDWPPRGRTEIFFDGEERAIDGPYVRAIFARFLPRAYRRPVSDKEVDNVVSWVLRAQEANKLSGTDAVREGVKMVLCSPGFLLIQEPAGETDAARKLTDHELACRLSYFLWSTMPDAELFQLAAENKLHDPKILAAQVRRMLAAPASTGLVQNFTGQWLKVREFSSVITDRNQYKSYDDDLRDSSQREPFEFFQEVLRSNLSILNFVDSDFLTINDRLAAHYGIEGVKGDEFRKVAIRPEQGRGGVLGMAGVLTYGSDGLRTLPVRRAAYVLDALWNAPPPPPPPNVGDLPPVGKVKTVRERLELHRKSDSCASCHSKIDPFGMALENYDAIGAWRDRQNGERFKGDQGSPPLDVSGVLPGGREFKNVREFKDAMLAEKERFLRGFVEKMLAYALGRPVGATDRKTVAAIIKSLEPANAPNAERYRLQDLIQTIVADPVFQTK